MKKLIMILSVCLTFVSAKSQITILNTNLNSMNVTAQSLCQVSIMNGSGSEKQAVLEAKLLNTAGENILTVKTMPFTLAVGINNGTMMNPSIQTVQFGANGQSEYVRTSHILPSGNFKFCVSVIAMPEGEGDDYCEDIISDISSFLNLVFPNDKDTIETTNPVLVWSHSEPFNILSPGDHFKLIVVELKNDQSAEAGIQVNIPNYFKEYLTSHQILYPYDAISLEEGKKYGWQVQKLSNGTIIDKTEAWEFSVKKDNTPTANKYTTLKKNYDANYYTVLNDKIYFRFIETYSEGQMKYRIINDKLELVTAELTNEKIKNPEIKNTGSNYYELDISGLKLKKGFYHLEVENTKGEINVLKFKID